MRLKDTVQVEWARKVALSGDNGFGCDGKDGGKVSGSEPLAEEGQIGFSKGEVGVQKGKNGWMEVFISLIQILFGSIGVIVSFKVKEKDGVDVSEGVYEIKKGNVR